MIVVDASAMIEVPLDTPGGQTIRDRLLADPDGLHAPQLLDLEVAQALRRIVRLGDFDAARGQQAIVDLTQFPLARHSHVILLERIWQLRNNLSSYDASYVALAESLDAPLLTRDAALSKASGHYARIELV